MKKLINVLFCLLAVYGTAQVTYGLKAGVNVSKIDEVHTGSDKRIGGHFGAFATIPINSEGNQFYVQPEVLYSMMGEKEKENNKTEDVNIDYISVPVLFKAYFSEQDTEFFGEIGPQIGFLINKDFPEGYTDAYEYKSMDFGATVGLGFSYLRAWEATARFYYGFADIIEWKDSKGKDPHNINSNVSVGIAYRFQ